MLYRIRPYDGNEPFLFFSYCRKNADEVYPIIERMACDGYRIWYDDGINPGEDWLEVIADHLHRSSAVIVALTPESTQSHNCRNEMNFAMEYHKPVVSVLLSDFSMPLAVRLQMGTSQYVKKYEYRNQAAFYETLYAASCLEVCLGPKQRLNQANVQQFEAEQLHARQQAEAQQLSARRHLAKAALEQGQKASDIEDSLPAEVTAGKEETPEPSAASPEAPQEENGQAANKAEEKCGQAQPAPSPEIAQPPAAPASESPVQTPEQEQEPRSDALLVSLYSGAAYPLQKDHIRIGRLAQDCDIAFPENPKISRDHAELLCTQGQYSVLDQDSLNHTYLNGTKLEPQQPRELRCFDELMMAQERLIFLSEAPAQAFTQTGMVAFLRREGNGQPLWIENGSIVLGRAPDIKGSIASDRKVSRQHAELLCHGTRWYIKDLGSVNGTFVNEHRLSEETEHPLHSMDKVRLGDTVLRFVALKQRL